MEKQSGENPFLPEFVEDANRMINELAAWEVANWYCGPHLIQDVSLYSDEEMRQAIVQDVLQATFYELYCSKKILFTDGTLCRAIPHDQIERVLKMLEHPEICGLVTRDKYNNLRIRTERACLQAAMDYCGVYYNGYDMPAGVIRTDPVALQEMAAAHGGIDQVIESIMMELEADIKSDKRTLN